MRTVVAAFEKQLDSLYGAEALDISTDITVLETMMAREGLTEDPLKPANPTSRKIQTAFIWSCNRLYFPVPARRFPAGNAEMDRAATKP